MQLRCITDQNRKEMLNALAWLCILPVVRACARVGVFACIQAEENTYKTCTHKLSDYCDVLSMLGKVE